MKAVAQQVLLGTFLALLTLPAVAAAQFNVTTNADSTITIAKYTGTGGVVSIPNMFTGMPVARIGTNALSGCPNLTSVTMPKSVTSIGDLAFDECLRLASVTIPDSVVDIGKRAFSCCPSLTSLTIPDGVTNIGKRAFSCCTSLASVTIPDSVTSIEGTFDCGILLDRVTIGKGVTNIGTVAFAFCSDLKGIYFKGNAPSLGDNAFEGDDKATVYYLPGTIGWGTTFGGRPTAVWSREPEKPR